MIAWITTLCNSRKLWAMQFRATHTGWVMVESSDKLSLEKGLANHLSILAWRTPRSLLWWVSKLKYVQRWFAYVYKISVSFRSTIEMIMQSKRKLIFIAYYWKSRFSKEIKLFENLKFRKWRNSPRLSTFFFFPFGSDDIPLHVAIVSPTHFLWEKILSQLIRKQVELDSKEKMILSSTMRRFVYPSGPV